MFTDSIVLASRRSSLVNEIKNMGITDQRILDAMLDLPRHWFLESALAEQAYENKALPIEEGQTISQPYTVAYQTQALALRSGDKVLEIGTGSGYQAAILVKMGMDVYTIERNQVLYNKVVQLFYELGINAHCIKADGTRGYPNAQPYNAILVTAGGPDLPRTLMGQLAIGGRMIIPIGGRETQTMKRIIRKTIVDFEIEDLDDFRFVPLIGQEGWKE